MARQIDDPNGASDTLCNLGDVAYRLGDGDAAEKYAQESLALCQQLGNRQGMAFALRVLGFAALLRQDFPQSRRCHEESLAVYQTIGDRWGVATCYINLGEIARTLGQYQQAAEFYEKSLPITQETGARLSQAINLLNLTHVHTALDHDDLAWQCLVQALKEAAAINAQAILVEGLAALALLHARAGNPLYAAQLLGMVQAHPAYNQEVERNSAPVLEALHLALSPEQIQAALEQGSKLDHQIVLSAMIGDHCRDRRKN